MIVERKRYYGVSAVKKAQEIRIGASAFCLNADLRSLSSIGPQQAYSIDGNSTATADVITRKFTYERSNDYKTELRVRDDLTNTIVEYKNPGDDRNSENGEWLPLLTGQTTGTMFGFTPYNDTGVDKALWCNAVDNFRSWTGAICLADGAIVAASGIITVKKVPGDPKTNPTDGFPASGSFTYRDTTGTFTTVTYSGKTGTTFTGCSGATTSAGNTGIADITTAHSGIPKNNILLTAQGRVVAAGRTDALTQIQGSEVGDFTNWTPGTTPDSPFAIDFPEGGNVTALAHKDEWIFGFKAHRVLPFKFQLASVSDGSGGTLQTKLSIKKVISNEGAVNQKSLALAGDDIVFITPTGKVKRIVTVESEDIFKTEDLNAGVRPLLKDSVFDDACLEYYEDFDVLVMGFKKNSDSSENDYGEFIYLVRNEGGSVEAINISFHDWAINDLNVLDGSLKFCSPFESLDFKAFDGYSKNGADYTFEYITRIEDLSELDDGATFLQKVLEHLLIKGSIGPGTTLNCDIRYDDNGATATVPKSIAASDDEPYVTAQVFNALNSFPLGNAPLGGTIEDLGELSPFKVFFALPNQYRPYNWQIRFYTQGTGQRVEIDTHGFLVNISKNVLPNTLYVK